MKRLLALAVCLWALTAIGQPSRVNLYVEGTPEVTYEYSMPLKRAEKLPSWAPGSGAPPLPIGMAVRTGEEWLKKRNPEVKRFAVSSVTIARMITYTSSFGDHWYYRISFDPVIGAQQLYGGQFTAVVLFDNTIVEPRVRRQVETR